MILQDVPLPTIGSSPKKPGVDVNALIKLKLPPLNATVLRILELLRDPNISTVRISETVGFDPVLVTRLLKLANSGMYCRSKNVTSIKHAIEAVGIKSLYDIVMLSAMADGFSKQIKNTIYGRVIWEHSIVTGLLARELSSILGFRGTEEAFLCGLLHDIGKILLLKGEPKLFESNINQPSELAMLHEEEAVFGLTHAELGGYVTHKWRLPEAVCAVIMHHHRPFGATTSTVVTHLVNVADLIANVKGYGPRREKPERIYKSESIDYLKLNDEQIETVWDNIQDPLVEVLTSFK